MDVKEYPKCYALDKAGKIRVFYAIFTPTSTCAYPVIDTYTGLVGGKHVSKSEVVKEGKQGRTLISQAELVIASKYKEKADEGYKTIIDLSLKAESISRNDLFKLSDGFECTVELAEGITLQEVYRELGIKYNTDSYWRPLPMLAHRWKDRKDKVKYPQLLQPKLNGVRALMLYDIDQQEVVCNSRGGITYNVEHLRAQLEPFFLKNQNVILDGELYKHGVPLETISGAVRNRDCPNWVEFHIYDCISELPQDRRLSDIRIYHNMITTQYNASHIQLVPYDHANNSEDIDTLHNYYVSDGYEGGMARDPSGSYEVSFRSNNLLKIKSYIDEEFELIGCEVDPGKTIGESFVFVLRDNINSELTFKARPTGSIEDKEKWFNNQEWIGKIATVRFQERSQYGVPCQGHVRAEAIQPNPETTIPHPGVVPHSDSLKESDF